MRVGSRLTDLKPQPGMPMAWRTKSTSWAKKMKKKTKKLKELSLLQGEKVGRAGELGLEEQIVGVHSNFPITPAPQLTGKLYTWGGTSRRRSRE